MNLTIKRIYEKKIYFQANGENAEIMDLMAYLKPWSDSSFLPEKERIGYEFINGGLEVSLPETMDGIERIGSILENAITGWDKVTFNKLYKSYKWEKDANRIRMQQEKKEKEKKALQEEEMKALQEIAALQKQFEENSEN